MNEENIQPESTGQEADKSVADKLGLLDQSSLTDLIKSGFLNEEEKYAPTPVEQQDESDETVTSDEGNDNSEDESDQSDESSLSKGVQKRINKLVAAKKAAQAELDAQKTRLSELQRELESAKTSVKSQQSSVSDFVESLDTQKQVQEEYKKALEVILWCEDNVDGGVISMPDGTESELTASEIRTMKRVAMKRKEIELPERMHFLQQQNAAESNSIADFPWWNKPESEEYIAAQEVLREFPELKKRRADWKHVAGLVVLGMKSYTDMKAKKTIPQNTIKRAPIQPGVKAAPAQTSQGELNKARQNFAKNSSDKNGLTDLVKAMGLV